MKKVHIIGGGTFSYVRNHMALSAPAFGKTARELHHLMTSFGLKTGKFTPVLHLTKMADSQSNLVTNEDVAALLETLKADPDTRAIILNSALCDYTGSILEDSGLGSTWHEDLAPTPSGSHEPRLKSRDGNQLMQLVPAEKLVGRIREERKDIFVVAFKTTTGETSDSQYAIALNALKRDGVNLVFANDMVTRNNMIVAPEETRYFETTNRNNAILGLAQMVVSRMENTFTRSTVVPGDSVPWSSDLVPDNLRAVVNHCIQRGAYKPVRGVTAGHFAVRLDKKKILTSKRKRNFNELDKEGLVLVEYVGDDKVIAHGAKPSVGGQSQRIVFTEHPDVDCIVHFHCPMKADAPDAVPVRPQWQNECGSHQCGANTSAGLQPFGDIQVVMLEGHGPNLVFHHDTPASDVIAFIERNFDLDSKTGGLVSV